MDKSGTQINRPIDKKIDEYAQGHTPEKLHRLCQEKKDWFGLVWFYGISTKKEEGGPRGVMVKAMDCGIVVREFVLQSRYYVHFRANTLRKGMTPLSSQLWVK